VRADLETFEVENPRKAMQNFREALARIVKVPKSIVDRKRKRAQAKHQMRPKL